jgi:hypothetical protein
MITEKDIQDYLAPDYPKHSNWKKTVDIAKSLQVHSKGICPDEILKLDRPNEPEKYKEYRRNKLVFSPKTKSKWGQISATTDKIAMAEDWGINFPPSPPKVVSVETLEEYTTKNYPYFDSIKNWYFTVGKKAMEDDPNGIIAVYPIDIKVPINPTEYRKPFAFIYPSHTIIDFREGEFCAILCDEKTLVTSNKIKVREGRKYLFFDRDTMILSEQYGDLKDNTFLNTVIDHNIGYMPAFKLGGIVESFEDNQIVYNSFYAPVLPDFNEALARYSDHQVNMALHLHPDRWEMATSECKVCSGVGKINREGKSQPCKNCDGVGMVTVKSPFGVTTIKPSIKDGPSNVTAIPTPPAGYVVRPIETIAFLKQEVADLIQSGFDSLNLGLINKEPEVNSGIAKGLDRQEARAFYGTLSRHMVENNLNPIFFFTNEWRYGIILSFKEREEQMPIINIPTRFDIMTAEIAAQRLKLAIESNFDSTGTTRMNIEYFEKELGKDAPEVKKMKVISKLDPLPNYTPTEKNDLMINAAVAGAKYEDYFLSINIHALVERAINEEDDFLDLDYEEQVFILEGYVKDKLFKGSSNVPIVNEDGTITEGEDINTPVDIEAEAKARLKGSVGGVQGILQIQASVSAGITDFNSAVVLLGEIYGYPPAIAKKMLGSPKKKALTVSKPAFNKMAS